jgi:SAM-dependent methyltransferase
MTPGGKIMNFVDPFTKRKLSKEENGNLYHDNGKKRVIYMNNDGIYDFTSHSLESLEKKAYDHKYADSSIEMPTLKSIQEKWNDEINPSMSILLNSLGDLSGKQVLLLGNGVSLRELYFLHLGAKIVYTDLSFEAVKSVQYSFSSSELNEIGQSNIEFHAVDALHLPFEDASFDVIYGCSFVSHVADSEQLFSEIYRCLKSGGVARFKSDAYSPIWQFMKTRLLKPLFDLRLKKRFISPEDLRHTLRGGFRREEIIT